ncbi:12078_t:CDS:2, partial [Gigaspora margarita]
MIETVDVKHELIKNSFEIIWKATNEKITSVTFNNNLLFSVTFDLNDRTSETLQLDAPDIILIKKENFIKFLNIVEPNEKTQITIDVDEDYEVNQESRMSDSVYDITDQKTNIGSSFEISEKGSTNLIEKAEFSHVDNEPDSTLQPSSIKENAQQSKPIDNTQASETQAAVSDFQELLQNNGSHSDEYSDTKEEINELIFDSLASSFEKRSEAISSLKGNPAKTKSQSKINKNFKTTKKLRKIVIVMIRVPSDLTNDSLPSISEVLGESFIANIVKSINENTNLFQTSNNLEYGESTSGSQLNNGHETNEMEILSDLVIYNNNVRVVNMSSIPSHNE